MKRIAIITYSRAYNYGSALQTYALNHYLTLLGNDVKTIDYTTQSQQELYTIFEPLRGVISFLRNIQSLRHYYNLKTHKKRFDEFLSMYVPMTLPISSSEAFSSLNAQFDYFISGSDQIWNAQCDDFDSNYMLSFVQDKHKCIAYAPSLGAGANDPETIKVLREHVKSYKALSSRERESTSIIERATFRSVENVLDPVFLLDAQEWNEIARTSPINGEYILGYFIGDVPGMRDFAAQLSRDSNCPVVVIWKSIRDIKYGFKTYYEAGPREFISLIKGCKYVVTNSFHAVSFSLIFGKSFWAFIPPKSDDDRLKSILDLVNLSDRIVDIYNVPKIEKLSPIDYNSIDREKLNMMIESSKYYLKNNIRYGTL